MSAEKIRGRPRKNIDVEEKIYDRSFKSLVESVKAYKVMYDSVAMAFHPSPEETMIETAKGWVRVGIGEAGFQTNRGIFVKL